MNNNNLILGVAVAAAGLGLVYLSQSRPNYTNPLGPGYTPVPPGGYYGPYQNQGNTALYVNFAGQIFNVLGQLVGDLADAGIFTPGQEEEEEDGYVMLGPRVGSYGACQCSDGHNCISTRSGTCECCDGSLIRNVFAYAKNPKRMISVRPVGGL